MYEKKNLTLSYILSWQSGFVNTLKFYMKDYIAPRWLVLKLDVRKWTYVLVPVVILSISNNEGS